MYFGQFFPTMLFSPPLDPFLDPPLINTKTHSGLDYTYMAMQEELNNFKRNQVCVGNMP